MTTLRSVSPNQCLPYCLVMRNEDIRCILIIKPTRCTNFPNLFLEQNSTCFGEFLCLSSASSQHNLYDIYLLLCVQCQTPDDRQRNCQKHVQFYSKNKFEKLMHLLGFIIRIYHDARSSECHIRCVFLESLVTSVAHTTINLLKPSDFFRYHQV